MGLAPLRHVGSSWTDKDRTHVPCLGRWMLNHWTTREVLSQTIFMTVPQRFFLLPLLPVHPHVLSGLGVLNHRSDHNIILSALRSIMQTLPIVSLPPPTLFQFYLCSFLFYVLQTRSETLHLCTPEVGRCDLCSRCFLLTESLSMKVPPPRKVGSQFGLR